MSDDELKNNILLFPIELRLHEIDMKENKGVHSNNYFCPDCGYQSFQNRTKRVQCQNNECGMEYEIAYDHRLDHDSEYNLNVIRSWKRYIFELERERDNYLFRKENK